MESDYRPLRGFGLVLFDTTKSIIKTALARTQKSLPNEEPLTDLDHPSESLYFLSIPLAGIEPYEARCCSSSATELTEA